MEEAHSHFINFFGYLDNRNFSSQGNAGWNHPLHSRFYTNFCKYLVCIPEQAHKVWNNTAVPDRSRLCKWPDGRFLWNARPSGSPLLYLCRGRQNALHGNDPDLFCNNKCNDDNCPRIQRFCNPDRRKMLHFLSGGRCNWLHIGLLGLQPHPRQQIPLCRIRLHRNQRPHHSVQCNVTSPLYWEIPYQKTCPNGQRR